MNFLTPALVTEIAKCYETPVYVYSETKLLEVTKAFLAFPSAFGHRVRFAMKANSNRNILKLFKNQGLLIDASSEYEVLRALNAGFEPHEIQLSGQETPGDLKDLLETGVFFVATSLNQLEAFGKLARGREVGVRLNPGMGSGAFKAIATGGETSAFGIWHEYIPEVKRIALKYDLLIRKIHIHIGSENTPESWTKSAGIGLDFVRAFESVTSLDLGGGFKMAIMPYEKTADLQAIGASVAKAFETFYQETGRKITLEVEPGKYMVINSASVIAKVDDVVGTGKDGYTFLRTNTGMTEMPRVTMYGVQQPITIVNDASQMQEYVVVGHCCESGDVLTCKLYDQETLEPRVLSKASVGDLIVFDGAGAYNASMSMKNYNSFPEAGELLVRTSGEVVEIRKRQKLQDIWKNEQDVIK